MNAPSPRADAREHRMTEYFTRDGRTTKHKVRFDEKGNAYFVRDKVCSRCGGAGEADKWAHTGRTCFDCRGRGTVGTETVKLYTADKLAKLNATKAKADAKRQAKRDAIAAKAKAEADARSEAFLAEHAALIEAAKPHMNDAFIADVMNRALAKNLITEKQAAAVQTAIAKIEAERTKRAASGHVGEVGKRIEIAVTVERIAHYVRPSFAGYGTETVAIITMRDSAGNAIVSKSSSFRAEKDEAFTIRATVKEHGEYNGEKQTIVQRVAILKQAVADDGPAQ